METADRPYNLNNVTDFKEYLYLLIDRKSQKTIFEGFTFDSKSFSLSISAQINWSNLLLLPDFIYPLTISCTDESTYILALENKMNFYLAAVGAKNGALQAGTALKQTVLAATTIQELEQIVLSL